MQLKDGGDALSLLGFLNSAVASHILPAINPTLNLHPGYLESLPFAQIDVREKCKELVQLHETDWNTFEVSWNFTLLPMVERSSEVTLAKSWEAWFEVCQDRFQKVKGLEEDVNRIFIDAYELNSELKPEVPANRISIYIAERESDCQRLISYAIGCMMGRYSLDEPGLIYAHTGNVGFDPIRYEKRFPADADGIVPITDERWFEDDVSSRIREFVLAVWGAERLEENMVWLAESVGQKESETPDETIRRYLADKFFKDHLQTYKKRPIYWLFRSGKQGAFQALVYLHRYNEGTLSRMRAEYVVPLIAKVASRLDMLGKDVSAASSAAARTKLQKQIEALRKKQIELLAYDEKLRHYADMRITLDLDDGVKVNYAKFGDLVAESKVITGGSDE